MTDEEIIQQLWRKSQIYFNSTDDAILRELIRRYQNAKLKLASK